MKWLKYVCVSLLLLSVFVMADGKTAFAAEEEEYTYTVRLYAGNLGTLTEEGIEIDSESASISYSGDEIVITGLKYRDTVYITPQAAAVSMDDRYYVRGVKRSGRDNSEAEAPSFSVGSDRDFVVAYGVSGETVAYTVNYVDMDGREILTSDTYRGNIGERQYISSRYIDGYQPQVLNMVKTLSANEAENVFTFQYVPESEAGTQESGAGTPGEGVPGDGADEAEEEQVQQIGEEDVPLGGDMTGQIADEDVPLGQKLVKDLDDEEVPLGTFKDEIKNTVLGYFPVYIGIGIAALAILAIAAVYLKKRRKAVNVETARKENGVLTGRRK